MFYYSFTSQVVLKHLNKFGASIIGARAAALEALAEARQALEAAARAAAMGALAHARSRALEAAARAAAMGAVAERRIELPMAARAVATPAGAGGRPKPADWGEMTKTQRTNWYKRRHGEEWSA